MQISIGIDQSFTSTAVVIMDAKDDRYLDSCIISTKKVKDDRLDKIYRARYISDQLISFINQISKEYDATIQRVNIEGIGFGARGNVTRDLAGLQYMMIDAIINRLDTNPGVIAPTSLKKFATGKGNADKASVMDATPEYLKLVFLRTYKKASLNDFCDAYWLCKMDSVL